MILKGFIEWYTHKERKKEKHKRTLKSTNRKLRSAKYIIIRYLIRYLVR